jgi:hypothetical protein
MKRMKARHKQHGATLVEGAVIMLVFFGFLFAVLEFGRAYNMYQVLTNAAREGARFAVAPCSVNAVSCPYAVPAGMTVGIPTPADIQTQANQYLASNNIRTDTATVQVCSRFYTTDCSDAGFVAPTPTCGTPAKYCSAVNGLDTYFTSVRVTAPYSFLFFTDFGTITIAADARMRDETN